MPFFPVDEDLPRLLARMLRQEGFQAEDARDAGLRGRGDSEIHEYVLRKGRTLVTSDLEFGNPHFFPAGFPKGLVICRFPNELPFGLQCEAILSHLKPLPEDSYPGAILILEPQRLRIHR